MTSSIFYGVISCGASKTPSADAFHFSQAHAGISPRFFIMKQQEFIDAIRSVSGLSEELSAMIWETICLKMADSIANGHGFGIPHIGRIYIRTHRVGSESINFINFQPSKEAIARLNHIEDFSS